MAAKGGRSTGPSLRSGGPSLQRREMWHRMEVMVGTARCRGLEGLSARVQRLEMGEEATVKGKAQKRMRSRLSCNTKKGSREPAAGVVFEV